MSASIPEIRHEPAQSRFVIPLGSAEAELCYQLADEGATSVMTITHTEVPAALEGQGLAGRLTAAAIDHARAQGWRVRPVCSYARAWMRRHPASLDLLAGH